MGRAKVGLVRAAGVTTVDEVLSVTTAKEVESATQNQSGESVAKIAVAA